MNNSIVFDIHENIGPCILSTVPRGYRKMTVHIIFDVKLDAGFNRKARLVLDGHKLDTPPSITYAYVVSRDSVRIVFLIAALSGLYVQCAYVQNY